MAFCTVFGWLVLGLPATGLFFYRFSDLGIGMRLWLAVSLPFLVAIVAGQLAFVVAYVLSPLRPYGAAMEGRSESARGQVEPPNRPRAVPEVQSVPDACPKCSANLRGEEIPAADRAVFGGATHFSRVIGIYSHQADATVAWQCPECGHEWERTEPFSDGLRTYELISRFGTETG